MFFWFQFVLIVFVSIIIVKWFRKSLLVANVPTLSGHLPIIGHFHKLFCDSKEFRRLTQEVGLETIRLGGVAKAWIGPYLLFSVTNLDECYKLVNTVMDKHYIYYFSSPWLGNGLVTAKEPLWRQHRKLLNPAFNQHILDSFQDIFNKQAERLVLQFEERVGKGDFDHKDFLVLNNLETICLTAIGLPEKGTEIIDAQYVKAVDEMMEIMSWRVSHMLHHRDIIFNLSPTKRIQDKAVQFLLKYSAEVLEKRKAIAHQLEYKPKSDKRFRSFMDILLYEGWSDQEITDEINTIIVAGHDTIAHVLLFGFMLLGSRPDVQEKIYKEIKEIFGDEFRSLEKEDLSKLTYTEAVIKETLRLYPVGTVTVRNIDRDVKIDKYTAPAGSVLLISLWALCRHPVWGPDSHEFRPERWLDVNSLPKHPAAFAAFSFGKRNCIGKNYAMQSMKTIIVNMVQKFKIKSDFTKLVTSLEIMLRADSGSHISLEYRN